MIWGFSWASALSLCSAQDRSLAQASLVAAVRNRPLGRHWLTSACGACLSSHTLLPWCGPLWSSLTYNPLEEFFTDVLEWLEAKAALA
jgi:hypothetical protein